MARRARSTGACSIATSIGRLVPSAIVSTPLTSRTWRRSSRAGVLKLRCAYDSEKAAAEASSGASASPLACAASAVSTGNEPHASAKPASVWTTPPNSSALVGNHEQWADDDERHEDGADPHDTRTPSVTAVTRPINVTCSRASVSFCAQRPP